MKKKWMFALFFFPLGLNAQIFEKHIYPNSHQGNLNLRESVVTTQQADTSFCAAGFYYYNQGSSGYYRPVLYNRQMDGTTLFNYSYDMKGTVTGTFNARNYAVAEDSVSGFITIGEISNYGSNTVTGGGDILLLSYDANGNVTKSNRIDFGYDETGYDIIPKNGDFNKFIICGTAKRSTGSNEAFIAEIDRNLNVVWVTRMALKISTGVTNSVINSLAIDSNGNIWGVGSILPFGSLNMEHLLVKLSGNGTYQYAERFYRASDREVLNDVSIASDGNLLITGRSVVALINPSTRLFVAKYNPATRTLLNSKFLRTPEGSNYKKNAGHEIIEVTNPANGNTEYFVAGISEGSTSAISDGLLYHLDANFSAQWQVLFEANNNIELYDVNFSEYASTGYLNLSGFYKNNSTYDLGYDIKTDLNGYSGCSDQINEDTLAVTLSIDTLNDSIYTSYNDHFVDTAKYVLYDSVSCEDQNAMNGEGEVKSSMESISVSLYPNPVQKGSHVFLHTEAIILDIRIYNLAGRELMNTTEISSNEFSFSSDNFESGIYIVRLKLSSGEVKYHRMIITD